MAYVRNLNALSVACLTAEQRARTCGYWYCVSDHGTAQTAFRTRFAFLQWLGDRNLEIDGELPPEGVHGFFTIKGTFRTAMHMDREIFDHIDGKSRLQVSNGEYTLATLAPDPDGIVCEHVLNPNVKDRPTYDYREAQRLIDAGKAEQLPRHIGGRPPYNPRFVAYATAHGNSVERQLSHDRDEWKGGSMTGFILWNRARLAEFSRAHPEAFMCGGLVNHSAYDAWLASGRPSPALAGKTNPTAFQTTAPFPHLGGGGKDKRL